MKFEIMGKPIFRFPLTLTQVRILMKLSEAHYDAVCRSASKQGGFIYGWRNVAEANSKISPTKKAMMRATWDELDITLKILEASPQLVEHERPLAFEMTNIFRGALGIAREEMKKWNIETTVENINR
jgi:hypothetical protein